MDSSADLTDLVRRAQAGDETARSRLLERATRLVYGRVLRALEGQPAAQDVAQDALLQAARGLGGLRMPETFLRWLRRITDNVLADHWRAGRRASTERSAALDQAPAREETADRAFERREDRERVRAALAGLRPRSRLALELCYFHDLTSREVAYFLGVSDEAARASLARAQRELRRRISAMAAIDTPAARIPRIRYSTTSGPGAFRGPVLAHDSATAQLYLALYPAGDAREAAEAAGLAPEDARRELERLEALQLVVRQAEAWRCTMPVVNETDMELIRLWAQPIAQVAIPHLESLHREALSLSQHVHGERAAGTVMAVAMVEAARRPFAALHEQLAAAAPERGAYGPFSAAVYTCQVPEAKVLRGGYSSGHSDDGDGREIYTYYLHPAGTRRPGVEALLQAFDLHRARDPQPRALLRQAVREGITPELRAELADALQIPPDRREAFWRSLVELGAVAQRGSTAQVILPVVPLDEWQGYLARLAAIGEEITGRVADAAEGLRRRAARCSFADCYFADAVPVFITCAAALVGRIIDEQGWVSAPAEADLSWGVLIAA
ncbi:MAG: sigma-70 family RNA polymerase sigma factor [Candidatus Latescibacterota bacterium]